MQKWNGSLLRKFDDVVDGNASVGTTVVVRNTVGNTLAVIYDVDDTNSVQKNNPFVTDDFGRYSFFAPNGKYTIEFGDGSDSIEISLVDNLKLQELDGLTEPSDLDQVHTRTFANVAAMLAFNGFQESQQVECQGYYAPNDGGGTTGIVKVGAHVEDGGSIFSIDANTYVEANLKGETVNGLKFGMKPLGGDCTAQYQAFRDYMVSTLVNLNKQKALIPTGRYEYTVSPNWAINALEIEFSGEVWLINNGTGPSFVLDGGATGAGVNGMIIRGYPRVYGGAATQHGYYVRAVHRSDLEINCRGAGSSFAGLYQEWNVSNTIKFIMNFNDGGLYNTPAYGIHQTLRAGAEETSYCTMLNVECSGMPVGIYQDGALGNVFIGGAVQACTDKGIQQTANSWNNKFYGTDLEVNTNSDIECDGRENQFFGVDCEKKIKFTANAVNCSVFGGITEDIEVDAGADRTLLSGVTYNRFGAGAITDSSQTTRYRDIRNKALGVVSDKPREINDIVVGVSPFTYTNTGGQDEDVLISGGTVSQVAFVRFAGYVVPVNGIYKLSPADSISVTYSSPPVMKAIPQ